MDTFYALIKRSGEMTQSRVYYASRGVFQLSQRGEKEQ